MSVVVKPALFLLLLFLVGCDSSPLKSDMEVKLNAAYGTDFDYLDTIEYTDLHQGKRTMINQPEKVSIIINTLTNETKQMEHRSVGAPLAELAVLTSDEGKEYNTKQTSAVFTIVNVTEDSTIVQYNRNYYSISANIINIIKEVK